MSRQPTRPTFGWDNHDGPRDAGLHAVDDLPHQRLLTSGRAALFAAMRALPGAMFPWDRVWPGAPDFPRDCGARLRTHVKQHLTP